MNMNFVIAVNDEEIFEMNRGKKDVSLIDPTLIIQRNYTNIPKAYNDAISKCDQKYICFLHQDVFFPSNCFWDIKEQIKNLHSNWGVIGVAGVALRDNKKLYLGHVRDRGCEWGTAKGLPVEVDTLDELLLIIKNDGTLKFDEGTKNHFYGADICTQAKLQGKKCYAIDAYCHHNSIHGGELPPDFWESFEYMKNKYKDMLPIGTTCTVIQ